MREMLPERMTDMTGYPLSEMIPKRKAEGICGEDAREDAWEDGRMPK
jgi:hypothetical protein